MALFVLTVSLSGRVRRGDNPDPHRKRPQPPHIPRSPLHDPVKRFCATEVVAARRVTGAGRARPQTSHAGEQELPKVSCPSVPAPQRKVHFLIFKLTPAAAKVNFKPAVVDTRFILTPFWFVIVPVDAPLPTVAPATTAV
jgi:hypothetical protein